MGVLSDIQKWPGKPDCNCAAGPWSTDVEAAPRDGQWVLLAWLFCGTPHYESMCWDDETQAWCDGDGGYLNADMVIAWAAIHPPEVSDD